ncbi:MAG: SGNH/GDSL hydrolase family protein [Chthoniobacter sp.]|uniref:SGNH/GDSL hydrolase family protein n=1 Tax=Chthoniobacter sp. TaxID=2510640 RepID=UPI0032AB5C20
MNTPPVSSSSVFTRFVACAAVVALSFANLRAAEPTLQLKDGDVWVMAGDSITAQRLHTNYIEAFYRTKHPQWHLHFRNSGIGGNRVGSILARFDYDVAAWKPTIVSIELGMNDVNGTEDVYIKGMKELIAKIRAIPAQPVLISSSPVDDGSILNDWKGERCQKLHPFTVALKKLAAEENVVFVDQYHALLDVWGQNRRKGEELARKNGTWPPKATPVPAATPAPATPAVAGGAKPAPPKPVQAPIAPSLIPLGGNPVHPGEVGQFNMAAVILEGLKVDGDVSSATIKSDGKVVEAKHCKITDVKSKDGKLSFTRLDESGPWPIIPAAKSTLQILPQMLKLSQDVLKVPGLADGDYHVTINGKPAGTVSAKDLAAGWNLTTAFDSVIGERATGITALLTKLQGPLNTEWRAQSKAKDADKLAAAQKAIDDAEAEIQTAIQPVALHFEIAK